MIKKISLIMCVLIMISTCFMVCYAEGKTVQLGETGISFQVDSDFEVITNKNKKEYSQEIQRQITEDKPI